jgi:hypothetical protein
MLSVVLNRSCCCQVRARVEDLQRTIDGLLVEMQQHGVHWSRFLDKMALINLQYVQVRLCAGPSHCMWACPLPPPGPTHRTMPTPTSRTGPVHLPLHMHTVLHKHTVLPIHTVLRILFSPYTLLSLLAHWMASKPQSYMQQLLAAPPHMWWPMQQYSTTSHACACVPCCRPGPPPLLLFPSTT